MKDPVFLTKEEPAFPATVKLGDAEITLHADGTWSGDKEAFLDAVAKLKRSEISFFAPQLWLIAAELRRTP